jgi:hypothetical protein
VPDVDEERIETYLKRFRPVAAAPLPAGQKRRVIRRPLVFAAWALAATVLIALALFLARRDRLPTPLSRVAKASAPAKQHASDRPLTLRNANEMLARAPSYGTALERMAFHHEAARPPSGKKSALEVLSKEDWNL